jgi:hypothetical protein
VNKCANLTGNDWYTIYRFTIKVKCGVNVIQITVGNKLTGSPAALIFAVIQNQSECYTCKGSSSFYNKNTCKCECLDKCDCPKKYIWNDYPICGCKCPKVMECSGKKYFNSDTCCCDCKPIACLPYYEQDKDDCNCKLKCKNVKVCDKSEYYDYQ